MLQNVYNLPDLVDLALKVPEIGAVNFNILYIVLQTMITELRLKDVRPWCPIENPMLAKTALTRAKLKGDALSSVQSEDAITPETKKLSVPSDKVQSEPKEKEAERKTPEVSFDTEQNSSPTKPSGSPTELEGSSKDEQKSTSPVESSAEEHADSEATPIHEDNREQLPEETPEQLPEETTESLPEETTEPLTEETHEELSGKTSEPQAKQERPSRKRRERAGWDDITKQLNIHRKSMQIEAEKKPQTKKESRQVKDAMKYTQFDTRLEGTEEGLTRLSDIVDMLVNRMMKMQREFLGTAGKGGRFGRDGASLQDEVEGLDERVEDLEEARIVFDEDHERLGNVIQKGENLEGEVEEIKGLGNQIVDMQHEITLKANLKKTEESLASKADLELVNTKVGREEFETAIEELGEAIGRLGIKLQAKNEEWDERAVDIWKGIDAKMTKDVFDEAMIKLESRIIAIMYALKKLKKVVEELLYPDSSGVTRCILCRRPADISGHECIAIRSPKRPLKVSDDSSDGYGGKEDLRKLIIDTVNKRPKLDGPPYFPNEDIIFSVPYSSSTYRSTPDGARQQLPNLRVKPIDDDIEFRGKKVSKDKSEVPKLPNIYKEETVSHSIKSRRKPGTQISIPKKKVNLPHTELVFTNKMLENLNRLEEEEKKAEASFSIILNEKSSTSKDTSRTSSAVDIMTNSFESIKSFKPTRFMKDPLRRGISQSSSLNSEESAPVMALSPLTADVSSNNDSLSL